MSIVVKDKDDTKIPEDYVRCSEDEALSHQLSFLSNWKPKSDAWAFNYSPVIYSVSIAVSASMIAATLRRKLNVQKGLLFLVLPSVGVPSVFGPLVHQQSVTKPLLLQSACPVCLQMRSTLIQNSFAIAYPSLFGSALALFLAERFATYRLPEFSFRALPQFVNIPRNILATKKKLILGLAIYNTALAVFLTDRQAHCLFTISQKYDEMEKSEK